MIKVIGILLTLASIAAIAATTITRKGYYEVDCNGVIVSSHSTYHKALETAVNQPESCLIKQPNIQVTVTVLEADKPVVDLHWDTPTQREDGTALAVTEIDGYRIYWGTDPEAMTKVEVVEYGSTTTYSIEDMAPGTYYFAISTVDADGIEGARSETISLEV